MQNLTEGQFVKINDDNWDTLGQRGRIVQVNETNVVVLTEDGVTRTLSHNQVTPLNFLTEDNG